MNASIRLSLMVRWLLLVCRRIIAISKAALSRRAGTPATLRILLKAYARRQGIVTGVTLALVIM